MKLRYVFATSAMLCMAAALAVGELPPMPATPAPVNDLVYARPFKLGASFKHTWSKEQPAYTEGWLLVLRADPALIFPRQTGMPVLFVGDVPAQVLNNGHESGHVIALVPGTFNLKQVPIWFGTPGLPGEVTNTQAARERAAATNAGIRPLDAARVEAALRKGGHRIEVADYDKLGPVLTKVAEEFTPNETALLAQFKGMK